MSIAGESATPRAVADFVENHGVDLSWMEDTYQWFHAHPELSNQEKHTAARIEQQLRDMDCELTTGIGGYGMTAVFRNGDGPTVLMRADFDALPVTEATGLPYASTNEGVMHACGHDVHTTSLLGLCTVMNERRDTWSGTFIALFQPAEEITKGASNMIADGLSEKIPHPDLCLGQHILPGPKGQVHTAPGPVLAACDTITVKLFGQSAHGSAPHESIDPTYLAAMIVVRLQGIVGRETPPGEFTVITVGTLSSGHTNNTIPTDATLVLNCRFYNTEIRDQVYAAIERVVRGECAASGCTREPEFTYSAHGELTDNDSGVFDHVRPFMDATFQESSVDSDPWSASEDFSEIPRHLGVPYLFWTFSHTPDEVLESDEPTPGNHHEKFAPAPGASEVGTKAALTAVMSYLFNS